MIRTYPHLGKVNIFIRAMFDDLGTDYISPPPCSKRTLELGIKYAPELACLPLKINLGNFLEAIEQGADTIIITGGRGPCRFGYFGAMHREMLASLGHDVEVIILDTTNGIKEAIKNLERTFDANILRVLNAFYRAYRLLIRIDELDNLSYYTRPREMVKGATSKVMNDFMHQIDNAKGSKEFNKIVRKTYTRLTDLELDDSLQPLKVGIVGEIYTIIEPSTNVYIEEMLGSMGAEIHRSHSVSKWIKEHLVQRGFKGRAGREFDRVCMPYMNTPIGGHARETIGNSCLYADKGYDGIIQLYPLTCMPEIVASSILPDVSKDYDIPLLTLVIDEMTGEAGYRTRVDAFLDVLQTRRELKSIDDGYLLYRN